MIPQRSLAIRLGATALTCLGFCLLAPIGCTGTIVDPTDPGGAPLPEGEGGMPNRPGTPMPNDLPDREMAAPMGLRRLTIDEYDDTIRDLLEDGARRGRMLLPQDTHKPFDDYRDQQSQISDSLVRSVELLSRDIASDLMKDVPRRDRIIGCKPTAADCLQRFATRFGRRSLRRPLTDLETQIYLRLPAAANTTGDFYASVEMIVRAFLQDPEFLHRIEIGTPVGGVAGLSKLNDWEMASRLSYFLWGTMPSDALLDRAERGGLSTPGDVRAAAAEMLASDPRTRERTARFHGLWLGYENPTTPESMKDETRALLGRVIYDDKRPWQDVFRATETFVTYDLAKFYGLRIPGGTPWG